MSWLESLYLAGSECLEVVAGGWLLTKQVLLLSKHRGLLTREGVHQHIATLQQGGLRLGEDVGGGHGPGVVGGHAATELGVKGLEVARVEEVEGAGLLGGGGLRLEPVGGRVGLGLLGSQGLELLVVKRNKRLNSLGLGGGGLLRLLGEHSLLGHGLTGGDSLGDRGGPQGGLGPLDWGGLRLGDRPGSLRLRLLDWGGGKLLRLRLLGDKVLLESKLRLAGHRDGGGLGPGHLGGLAGRGGGGGRGPHWGGEGEALEVIEDLKVGDPGRGVDHGGGHGGPGFEPGSLSGGLSHRGDDLHSLDSLSCLSSGRDNPVPGA